MGANISQVFSTPEEADRWAEQQTRLAARWNLQKTADLGNRSVVQVPVVSPAGQPDEITFPIEPGTPVQPRIRAHLAKSRRFAGYVEDPLRRPQRGYVRSLRFD